MTRCGLDLLPRPAILVAAIAAAFAAVPGPAHAVKYYFDYDVWCGDVGHSTLVTAKGVPAGAKEDFTFKGECYLYKGAAPGDQASTDDEKEWLEVLKGHPTLPTMPLIYKGDASPAIAVSGEARWDRNDQTATELLTLSGGASGKVRIDYTGCFSDPFLVGAPKCADGVSDVQISAPPAYRDPLIAGLERHAIPLFWRRFDAPTAIALSEKQASAVPAPPPPAPTGSTHPAGEATQGSATAAPTETPQLPGGPGISRPAPTARSGAPGKVAPPTGRVQPLRREAEALLDAGALHVTGGQARVQPMAGFGPSWSGGQQVFWAGGEPGSAMSLRIAVDRASTYSIQLALTQAPDYGDLAFEVDGARSTIRFSGYASDVRRSLTPVGSFRLSVGEHVIRLILTGRSRSSSNYFAGIDEAVLIELPDR